jgi:arabinose-5-phosphate isomerase
MTKQILVAEVMIGLNSIPIVPKNKLLKEALEEMGKHRLGIACVIDDFGRLLGILTDGDIRRKLLKIQKPFSAFFVDDALDHAEKNPTVINPEEILSSAVAMMESKGIWDLPVVDNKQVLVGLLHLHPVVKALLAKA